MDEEIRQAFSPLVRRALAEDLPPTDLPPHLAHLAEILLLDQLTRNIYRDRPEAFAGDPLALRVAQASLERGEDRLLRPVQRAFCYLPFEHSENLQHQQRSVRLFRQLLEEVPKDWKEAFAGFLDYAERHLAIIERFGRFPHRNRLLGRDSTTDEAAFLKQPNSSF